MKKIFLLLASITTLMCVSASALANDDCIYSIDISLNKNQVMIYKKDDSGNYTIPFKTFVCSIGNDTPEGEFYTSDKYKWRELFGNVYGQYATRITGHILFHSVPYIERDKSTLEYEEYNKLGQKASMGCIRLCVSDAKWIYDNCPSNTLVRIFDDVDMPLEKPEAIKIDLLDNKKGWDPTDPDKNNPWNKTKISEEIIVTDEISQNTNLTETTEIYESDIYDKNNNDIPDIYILKNNKIKTADDFEKRIIDIYSNDILFKAETLIYGNDYYVSLPEIIPMLEVCGIDIDTNNKEGNGFTVLLDKTCSIMDWELDRIINENSAEREKSVLLCINGKKLITTIYSYKGQNMFNLNTVCSMANCEFLYDNGCIFINKIDTK